MWKFRMIIAACAVAFLLQGCGTTARQMTETYNSVSIDIGGKSNKTYRLINADRDVLSVASGRTGTLTFRVPEMRQERQCLYVVDDQGKSISFSQQGVQGFGVEIAPQHYAQRQEIISMEAELEGIQGSTSSQANRLRSIDNELASNRATAGSRCQKPTMRPIPRQPVTRCSSREECYQDGTQICFGIAFGAEGCSMALSSQGVPGVVAGPSCGYAATKLATEKYGLGSGIVDAIRGQVDDWAEQKARDGTISGFLQALVIKTANYASKAYSATQCRDAFVEEHYGPQERWRRQIADIKAEPSRSLARCTELRRERAKLIAENAGFSQRGDNLSKQIDTAKKQLARLEQQSQAVNLVCR